MTPEVVMEYFKLAIAKRGALAVGVGVRDGRYWRIAEDKEPLVSAELRPDGLIGFRTEGKHTGCDSVIDPEPITRIDCGDREPEGVPGEYRLPDAGLVQCRPRLLVLEAHPLGEPGVMRLLLGGSAGLSDPGLTPRAAHLRSRGLVAMRMLQAFR